MSDKNKIDTVLLDYGKVLAAPVTGNWFTTKNTRKILGNRNYLKLLFSTKSREAFKIAFEDLKRNHLLHTEEQEIAQFAAFYSKILEMTKISDKTGKLSQALAKDITLNDKKVRFYRDAKPSLTSLKENYKIAIISDTWPSLRRILKNAGIMQLLDGLVMSCDYNAFKSSTKLFEIAIERLSLIPQKTVFVDDSSKNLDNAKKVGFVPVLMQRSGKHKKCEYPIVHSLKQLEKLLVDYYKN